MPTNVVNTALTAIKAWARTRGAGTVVAVVDDDVDVESHVAFRGRVLPGYVHESSRADGRDRRRPHGTKVAGLVLAAVPECTGLAPEAMLLPVSVSPRGEYSDVVNEAQAIRWAADHGADVICCARAPRHPTTESATPPAPFEDAIDYCLTRGREGKGCVVVFSAGNDGSDLALNGYASHPGVIAVGACNCHGKHPRYSGWGKALWCVFPSNDPNDPIGASMTYLTTAPVGSLVDGEAYYTTRFGFTSAATAAVAGICALIVSANPDLTSSEVKAVLRDSCEKIDIDGGTYDEHGHSPLYGYGRPDVARAVELARGSVKIRVHRHLGAKREKTHFDPTRDGRNTASG